MFNNKSIFIFYFILYFSVADKRLLLNDPDVLQGQMLRMENAIANLNITVARIQADKDLLSQQVSKQTKLITKLQDESK